jgi:hypothetical protein
VGQCGYRPEEFYRLSWGEAEIIYYGNIRKNEEKWQHTRYIAAILINANRGKNQSAKRPQDLVPLSTDIIELDLDFILENFEKAQKAWQM